MGWTRLSKLLMLIGDLLSVVVCKRKLLRNRQSHNLLKRGADFAPGILRDLPLRPPRSARQPPFQITQDTWTSSSNTQIHPLTPQKRQKKEVKPWLTRGWCIPANKNGAFVAAMEDVLEVYHRPRSADYPLVCLDEASKQHTEEVRESFIDSSGRKIEDAEYKRNGTSSIFMMIAPLEGWRKVVVTDHRKKVDWAERIKELVDIHFPQAKKIILVQDNLNTHAVGSLYDSFPAEEAKRIADKIEFHYTPKHGSWLNIAECELSVYQRQCLNRRIPSQTELIKESGAWEKRRNKNNSKVVWQFSIGDARIKLAHLYPKL